jgi:hypothetical protein
MEYSQEAIAKQTNKCRNLIQKIAALSFDQEENPLCSASYDAYYYRRKLKDIKFEKNKCSKCCQLRSLKKKLKASLELNSKYVSHLEPVTEESGYDHGNDDGTGSEQDLTWEQMAKEQIIDDEMIVPRL